MKPFCVGCRDTVSTVLQPSWMSIWFLRKRRCQCRGTRHSVSPMVWVCEWLNIFAQWKQQRADVRVCIYLRVCVYVRHCGCKLTKASNCAAHGLLASDPSWSLVWNVIYLCHALETKIFIELPTTLHYLLTTSSTHCFVAVLLMWLMTYSLW